MGNSSKYYITLLVVLAGYFITSKYIFDKVQDSIHIVIDELFHIPQGLLICNGNLTYWDPKITTLPGLYLVSSVFLGSYFPCSVYNLRFINLIASAVNFLLLTSILKFVYGNNLENQVKVILQALNLVILPPLYFFSNVYYTDTLSLTFLLGFSRLCLANKHRLLIFVLGFWSVLMRQTNIVWIAMVFGHKVLGILIKSSRVFGNKYINEITLSKQSLITRDIDSSKLKRYYGLYDVYVALKYHLRTCFGTFLRILTLQDLLILTVHSTLLTAFVAFVYVNGSIVVGDKTAHEASLHLPQLLYFLVFYGFFGLPYVLAKAPSTLRLVLNNKIKFILLGLVFLAVVHFNTVVHPYLLADNRHYTFYLWNRWYGKYDFARYATIPVYLFLLFSLYDNLKDQNCVSFLLPFSVSLFLGVALQKMLEVRYYLIPYIILRLRFGRPSFTVVILEFIWYVALNAATYYVFFNKEIIWKDFDYVQRIIW